MHEAPIRICGNCVYWGDGTDYCPYTMNLYQAYEPGCVNHITVLELDADYRRMVGEEVANAEKQLNPCPFCGADEESGLHIETIWDDEEFVPEKFKGSTQEEAVEYIDRNIELYKLLTMDNWALEHGYF